jgi:transposase InsO family protein
MAVNRQFPNGARGHDLHLMRDNGCQPTSQKFMEVCSDLGIHQAFTSSNNPKGNADSERVNRTMKESSSGFANGRARLCFSKTWTLGRGQIQRPLPTFNEWRYPAIRF